MTPRQGEEELASNALRATTTRARHTQADTDRAESDQTKAGMGPWRGGRGDAAPQAALPTGPDLRRSDGKLLLGAGLSQLGPRDPCGSGQGGGLGCFNLLSEAALLKLVWGFSVSLKGVLTCQQVTSCGGGRRCLWDGSDTEDQNATKMGGNAARRSLTQKLPQEPGGFLRKCRWDLESHFTWF